MPLAGEHLYFTKGVLQLKMSAPTEKQPPSDVPSPYPEVYPPAQAPPQAGYPPPQGGYNPPQPPPQAAGYPPPQAAGYPPPQVAAPSQQAQVGQPSNITVHMLCNYFYRILL